MVSLLVFGGLIAGAATYRPSKTVEHRLRRMVTLPATRMTLADMSHTASYDHHLFPIQTSFCFADADKDNFIDFPRRDLTLGEFLDAIEMQSVLRRRFILTCGLCGRG
jgi:hypothetical protein